MTYKEIIDTLVGKDVTIEQLAWGDFNYSQFGQVKLDIEREGGEGEGEHWSTVHHFVDHDVYICITGLYTSYDGTSFWGGITDSSSVFEVRPTPVYSTAYVSLKELGATEKRWQDHVEKIIADHYKKLEIL